MKLKNCVTALLMTLGLALGGCASAPSGARVCGACNAGPTHAASAQASGATKATLCASFMFDSLVVPAFPGQAWRKPKTRAGHAQR